jgi:hypothetical protein
MTFREHDGRTIATIGVRAFGILRRVWSVQRRGRYEWMRGGDGRQIRRVEVLHGKVTSRVSLLFGSTVPAALKGVAAVEHTIYRHHILNSVTCVRS